MAGIGSSICCRSRGRRSISRTIIDRDTFEAAQDIFAGAQRTAIRKERTLNAYLLSGLVRCAKCGRKMQASWNHGHPYYRCKFPYEYAVAEGEHGRTVYVREDAIVPSLDAWI
jgi:site-specific DNA recombinase